MTDAERAVIQAAREYSKAYINSQYHRLKVYATRSRNLEPQTLLIAAEAESYVAETELDTAGRLLKNAVEKMEKEAGNDNHAV
ncbi:MAG: hypothetical protein IMZ50_16455 [Candidatus Atribacteria bacterium]|nr:hypothetical protein [Candidatus Atribacteria bacterium]